MMFLVIFLMNFIKRDSLELSLYVVSLCGYIILLVVFYLISFFVFPFTFSNIPIICCWASSTVQVYSKL